MDGYQKALYEKNEIPLERERKLCCWALSWEREKLKTWLSLPEGLYREDSLENRNI